MFFQNLNGLCVSHMTKVGIYHMVQSLDQAFINKLIKEVHLFGSILQNITDHKF